MTTKTQIKSVATTPLEKAVANIIANESDRDLEGWLNDLIYGGCQSGNVSAMIYYRDTLKFYKKHQNEIDTLLKEGMDDCGCKAPQELLHTWDTDDPLARETSNQNLLAWFAFEETARRLANEVGIEL